MSIVSCSTISWSSLCSHHSTFLTSLAVSPPTDWFRHFPGLLWATASPSVYTVIFINHAYLSRRARKLLQGWEIVMRMWLFLVGACVGASHFICLACLADETREVASIYTWANPLFHFQSQIITKPNYGTSSPRPPGLSGPLLCKRFSHHLRVTIICSLKQQIHSNILQHARCMLGAGLNRIGMLPALRGPTF